MNTEKIGEIFIDGRIINLDNATSDILNSTLQQLDNQKSNIINKLNVILSEI